MVFYDMSDIAWEQAAWKSGEQISITIYAEADQHCSYCCNAVPFSYNVQREVQA
jgi:hypothetical protein